MLLAVAFGPWIIAFAYALLAPGQTAAYNDYLNEYRKWPWRAGEVLAITTLPGQEEHRR
jgi:hypothetical protein